MNETMSLILATAILTVGGLGLYMYKNKDTKYNDKDEDEEYNEDNWFGFFGNDKKSDAESERSMSDNESEIYEPKVRSRQNKTKRSKKTGGTKRRY